ncbi:MAG: hypothetical protein IKR22_08140 [Clostridiales bacterium]|nr:hypothetical protein [Clostridiales bacterium]MBR6255375.1 hypothetical protein [Clostridiales bacterium]
MSETTETNLENEKIEICKICGAQLDPDSEICPSCGQDQSEEEPISANGPVFQSGKETVQMVPPPIPAPMFVNQTPAITRGVNEVFEVAGFVFSILAFLCLAGIQLAKFKYGNESHSIDALNHDLIMYPVWFTGLLIGTVFLALAAIFMCICFVKKHLTGSVIIAVFLCGLSIGLAVFSFTKLSDRQEGYFITGSAYCDYMGIDAGKVET